MRFGWSQNTKQRLIELMYSSSGTIIYYHIIGERGGHNLGNKVQDINNTLNSVRGGLLSFSVQICIKEDNHNISFSIKQSPS